MISAGVLARLFLKAAPNPEQYTLSKLAQPGFRSGPGGRGCCAKERVLFGEGSLAYAAGVLRNTPRVITTQREPKGSQGEPKGSQREPKGSQREPKGSPGEPKGSQKGSFGRPWADLGGQGAKTSIRPTGF